MLPLIVQDFPTLMVMAPLHSVLAIYVPPLEVHHICSVEIKTGFQFFLRFPNVFHQYVQTVPHYWVVVITPLNLHQIERRDHQKT